jgi:hypothetical protein
MTPDARERWLRLFDPSQYLGGVNCPILFLNGSNDFAYPMDSYRKSYDLVRPDLRTVSMRIQLPHGHIWTFTDVDAFVDHALRDGSALPRIERMIVNGGTATTSTASTTSLKKAELHFTTDTGAWQKRQWQTVSATLDGSRISAVLPAGRPLVCFLSVTDERGRVVTTQHEELAAKP